MDILRVCNAHCAKGSLQSTSFDPHLYLLLQLNEALVQLMKDSMGNQTHECMEQTFMTISKGAFPPSRELDCVKFTFSWLKFRSLGGFDSQVPWEEGEM